VNFKSPKTIAFIAILASAFAWWEFGPRWPDNWTENELVELRSLTLQRLPVLPPDPSNRVADDPRAAALGHQLFFDPRLSANGAVACATCHKPEQRFTDGLAKGRGIASSQRNTRSIVGTAFSPWQYWDGRRDSQWAQALSPLEDPAEHGSNRMEVVRFVVTDQTYKAEYEAIFGPAPDVSDRQRFPERASPIGNALESAAWEMMTGPDQVVVNTAFSNIGKVIAAYERMLLPGPTRFDQYVAEIDQHQDSSVLTNDEIIGLQLFISEARCTECHNGPLFTNHEFHNTGVLAFPGDHPDRGRIAGLKKLLDDPFNCQGQYSDDPAHSCDELTYVRSGAELVGAMRTPSLRNLGGTAPYSHKGQLQTLAEVIDLYNQAPLAMIGHNEAEEKLRLSRRERKQLEAFLNTLDAPIAADPKWLRAPEQKSSNN